MEKKIYYQINILDSKVLLGVTDLFKSIGIQPKYKVLDEPPHLGRGSLVQIIVKDFDFSKFSEKQKKKWLRLSSKLGEGDPSSKGKYFNFYKDW